jgi:hypothetical protein
VIHTPKESPNAYTLVNATREFRSDYSCCKTLVLSLPSAILLVKSNVYIYEKIVTFVYIVSDMDCRRHRACANQPGHRSYPLPTMS